MTVTDEPRTVREHVVAVIAAAQDAENSGDTFAELPVVIGIDEPGGLRLFRVLVQRRDTAAGPTVALVCLGEWRPDTEPGRPHEGDGPEVLRAILDPLFDRSPAMEPPGEPGENREAPAT